MTPEVPGFAGDHPEQPQSPNFSGGGTFTNEPIVKVVEVPPAETHSAPKEGTKTVTSKDK